MRGSLKSSRGSIHYTTIFWIKIQSLSSKSPCLYQTKAIEWMKGRNAVSFSLNERRKIEEQDGGKKIEKKQILDCNNGD